MGWGFTWRIGEWKYIINYNYMRRDGVFIQPGFVVYGYFDNGKLLNYHRYETYCNCPSYPIGHTIIHIKKHRVHVTKIIKGLLNGNELDDFYELYEYIKTPALEKIIIKYL